MKKRTLYWIIALFILVADAFFVYFGRIYYPENFSPQTVSFFENYMCVLMGLCLIAAFAAIFIGIILFLIILAVPNWERQMQLSIFQSWNPNGYQRIVDSQQENLIARQRAHNPSWPVVIPPDPTGEQRACKYKVKFRKKITGHILLETFDEEFEFYKAIKGDDTMIAKTKQEIIDLLKKGESSGGYTIGAYYIKLQGITIDKKKDEIIGLIEKLEDFKGIRITYFNMELSSFDNQEFERYQRMGFPTF